jgi:hypothetical protein
LKQFLSPLISCDKKQTKKQQQQQQQKLALKYYLKLVCGQDHAHGKAKDFTFQAKKYRV